MSKLRYSGKLARELWGFAKKHKMYWIVPLMLTLALAAALIVTSQSVAPFIYTLF